jgi:putative ABC transport system permease protein
MRVNFFVMFPLSADARRAGDLHQRLPRAGRTPGFDNALSRRFPNITNVDVSASIGQVQRVLDQVIRAVEFLFGFTLVAGLVVLFAAISATREARAREFAIMRAMGAGSACWRRCSGPNCWAWARWPARWPRWRRGGDRLAAGALRLRVQLEPHALGAAGGRRGRRAAGAGAGWWSLREVLRRPVLDTLRRVGAV